jgi:hypothetical protein
MRAVLGGVVAARLLVSRASAESSSGTWKDLSDGSQIDTGYSRLTTDTQLRHNGAPDAGDISFEDDLGVDKNERASATRRATIRWAV